MGPNPIGQVFLEKEGETPMKKAHVSARGEGQPPTR